MSDILLLVLGFYICQATAATNLHFRVGGPTPSSSSAGSSGNTARVCLGEEVTFTCTTSSGTLRWRTSATGHHTNVLFTTSSPIQRESTLDNSMLGVSFTAVLLSKDDDVVTSTLSATVRSDTYAGITVTCDDLEDNVDTLRLELANNPSAPGISVTQISLTAVNIELTPPLVGTECLSGYRVEYDGVSRSTGTSTSVVIRDLELCFKEYHFTAFGVTPGHLNGTRSRSMSLGSVPNPVVISASPGQGLCPDTVSLTWNQPTQMRGCVDGYTLETTSARGTQRTPVASTATSVGVGCCLRYNFTVIPDYTQSRRTTRNMPLSFISGQNNYPDPGNLQLTVMYGTTIAVTVRWQNADALRDFENYLITTCVNNNPQEKVVQRGRLTAPTNAKFLALDYMTYIGQTVPINVSFSRDDCTSSSSRSVTFPSIISGEPTVDLERRGNASLTATFTVTFATITSVTFDVASTAIVEVNVTALQRGADPIHETSIFPPDFPRVTTTEIIFTNLTQDTVYRYTVRVLTTSDYFTAAVIPRVVRGTFPITAPGESDVGRAIAISASPVLALLLLIIVMAMACLVWKNVSKSRKSRSLNLSPEELELK